jgi:hypothetical protein
MNAEEKRQIIAALVERTGVRLDEDDPAIVLVELNRLMLERSANDAAEKLTLVAKQFVDAATAQADDFVAVANEALSKFTIKTNELKQQIELVHVPPSPPATPAAAPVSPSATAVATPQVAMKIANIHIAFAIVLLAGVAVGVGLSFFL